MADPGEPNLIQTEIIISTGDNKIRKNNELKMSTDLLTKLKIKIRCFINNLLDFSLIIFGEEIFF